MPSASEGSPLTLRLESRHTAAQQRSPRGRVPGEAGPIEAPTSSLRPEGTLKRKL